MSEAQVQLVTWLNSLQTGLELGLNLRGRRPLGIECHSSPLYGCALNAAVDAVHEKGSAKQQCHRSSSGTTVTVKPNEILKNEEYSEYYSEDECCCHCCS